MVVSVIAERVPFWNQIAAAHLADVIAGSDRTVILLNGADRPISAHLQPFTVDVQKEMLTLLFPQEVAAGIVAIQAIDDDPYLDEARRRSVEEALEAAGVKASEARGVWSSEAAMEEARGLPDFVFDEVRRVESIGSTADLFGDLSPAPLLASFLDEWRKSDRFGYLLGEHRAAASYRAEWANAPYEPSFNTADALIEHEDDVLCVIRDRFPFEGFPALPGGFQDPRERLRRTSLREAGEEASMTPEMMVEFLVGNAVFDEPDRDPRGRFVSQVYHYRLKGPRPPAKAGSDARSVLWLPKSEIVPSKMAFDHGFAVREMLQL